MVGAVTVQRSDFGITDGTTAGASVPCPAGTIAIGGGSSITPTTADGHPTISRPDRTGVTPANAETFTGWRVQYRNPSGGVDASTVHAFAVCAED